MNGHTHLMVASGLGYILYPEIGLLGAGITALGGLLPDLDHPRSMLGKYMPLFSLLGGHHRGWFHTVVGLAAFTLPVMFYSETLVIGLAVGFASHLVLDSLNPTGIMWLWPITDQKYRMAKIRTGSAGDSMIFFITLLLVLGRIWYS